VLTVHGDYELDDDPERIDARAVFAWLSTEAYWGRWRGFDDFQAQLASAWRVVGAYERASGATVGFARAISDGVAFAYLADVFVVASARGGGLGKAIVRAMVDDGPGRRFRWTLHTLDAHGLYEPLGFVPPDATALERRARF
jgi:GNAT superfamily N-acetyltransferase